MASLASWSVGTASWRSWSMPLHFFQLHVMFAFSAYICALISSASSSAWCAQLAVICREATLPGTLLRLLVGSCSRPGNTLTIHGSSVCLLFVSKWISLINITHSALIRSCHPQVLGSSPGQVWSLPLSFISLGAGSAWQAISQWGKARMQDATFCVPLFCWDLHPISAYTMTKNAASLCYAMMCLWIAYVQQCASACRDSVKLFIRKAMNFVFPPIFVGELPDCITKSESCRCLFYA